MPVSVTIAATHLVSAFHVPGSVLSILHAFSFNRLKNPAEEESEAWRCPIAVMFDSWACSNQVLPTGLGIR